MPDSLGVVLLAAGQGTRMQSRLHKVLHPIAGLPLLDHVLRAAQPLAPARTVVVIGHGAEEVRAHLGDGYGYALQDPPRGTGDAVRAARPQLDDAVDTVLVLYGDSPLIRPETLRRLLDSHCAERPLVTILSGRTQDPGRVLRDERGRVVGVVEQELATPEQLALPERNSGVCAFDAAWLWPRLEALPLSGKGEYLLTDLVGAAVAEGERDGRWPVAAVGVEDPTEAMGVNTRAQLADAEAVMRGRILRDLMLSGVSVRDPATTYVDVDVRVGRDTALLPGTFLSGATVVGEGCTIGPNTFIAGSRIGDGCRVRWSLVEGSVLEDGSDAGPYAHIRPGSRIGRGAHIGSYVETKATELGAYSSVAHLSYVGDTEIGEGVNVGAGTINANYDHATGRKQRSVVRDGAALGSDTVLVAPVEVGEGARTGAGAVVTRDVPPHRTAVGVPARVLPAKAEGEAASSVGGEHGEVEGGTASQPGEGS